MKHQKENTFVDRRDTSLNAKKQLLDRIKSAPKPSQTELDHKQAEKAAAALARETRQAERQRLKKAEAERLLAEEEALAQAQVSAQLSREAQATENSETQAAEAAERKADRDRRYAARKARQR
ncbi:MAG TPA: DUF6481 family protein [Tianweitania sediminis]|jgi:PBP1b-binding outer membrane lipoprotein LpoB|nr:DUF6481 family protein [Tianweitania sediminis]